jgi:protein arginine kinase
VIAFDNPLTAPGWYSKGGPDDDVVVSTRLRLSRNLSGHLFAANLDSDEEEIIMAQVRRAFGSLGNEYHIYPMADLAPVERRILLERNLISQDFSLQTAKCAVIREDYQFSAMVNEVDHLRMALIHPGKDFAALWSEIDRIDTALEEYLEYSVSLEWGYLTPDVSNVGTGLKASAMCHLPALVETGMIEKALKAVVQLGFSVRGFFSDNENSLGYLYQIANPVAIGESEEDLTAKLDSVVHQLVHYERTAREEVLKKDRLATEDKIFRALGTLLHCRLLESKEAIDALNLVRFGIECELIALPAQTVTSLLFLSQKSHIQKLIEQQGTKDTSVDAYRARLIRETLGAGMAGGRYV